MDQTAVHLESSLHQSWLRGGGAACIRQKKICAKGTIIVSDGTNTSIPIFKRNPGTVLKMCLLRSSEQMLSKKF
jgi:hypothetical protein